MKPVGPERFIIGQSVASVNIKLSEATSCDYILNYFRRYAHHSVNSVRVAKLTGPSGLCSFVSDSPLHCTEHFMFTLPSS